MKRFSRKALIWLAGIFAAFIVLLVVFYAEEDWRGARDWTACQKELQAKGETLDLRQLVPPGNTSKWSQIYTPLSAASLPTLKNVGPHIAKAETYRRLARLACRLEEYRLAHNQYPEKLDDLPDLPAHLNQEVLSEEPLRYQRKGEGYRLYSVGWDQKDDGGVLAADDKAGDWPWPSP